MTTAPFWMTAFLDNAADHHDASVAFWLAATGHDLSATRGDDGEFATLLPRDGDPSVKVQRRREGGDRIHLDLHVPDPAAAAARAVDLGATVLADLGYVVLTSPGDLTFCLVSHPSSTAPRPDPRPDGSTARVAQVAIDVPRASYDAEWGFWAAVTGWEPVSSTVSEDFQFLRPPQGQPLRLLVQRLGADDPGPVRAHLDWATSDRAAEVARHVGLGARVVAEHSLWTVLAEPTGRVYCLTDQRP